MTGATSGRPAGHFQRGGLQKGEREERGGGGGAEKRPENCMTVWIGNLAKDVEESEIRTVMGHAGELKVSRHAEVNI